MGHKFRCRAVGLGAACLVLAALAPAASAAPTFHPRVAGGLGLVPPVSDWGRSDIAQGAQTPATYHGGQVMNHGVHVHVIFWDGGGTAGGGRDFQGSPGCTPVFPAVTCTPPPTYQGMIEQFFTDVAVDSGKTTNVFSVLPQFAAGNAPGNVTPGSYNITFNSAAPTDVIQDHQPYPPVSAQCASPQQSAICITDAQVQAEVDRVVQSQPSTPRGLTNLWYVFTPPDVDECIAAGVCETNAFGGYHSVSDVGHGTTIYAYTGDPIVESQNVTELGKDPNGNPDGEIAVDIAAHETVEAMTDPEGVGYMDPNGYEVGDKCEFGPQHGQPLGTAGPDRAPYNQVINGHQYYIQEMWANHDNNGNPTCVQSTTNSTSDLPLPQIGLTQFSGIVTGNTENNHSGIHVTVKLRRAGADGSPVTVASGTGTTNSSGAWSVTLSGGHVVGDDRDQVVVSYSGAGAPATDTIQTGSGGNPFTESGWTGWWAMDNGINLSAAHGGTLQIAPCFQTGVESATLDGSPVTTHGNTYLTDFCNTQTDVSTDSGIGTLNKGSLVKVSTLDDRAFVPPGAPNSNTVGALVGLTVTAGEPDSLTAVPVAAQPLPYFTPSGFPTCAADLEAKTVTCTGLFAGRRYDLRDGRALAAGLADGSGTLSLALASLRGGDTVVLSNGWRTLSTLHVAHLKARITGEQTVLDKGSKCEPNQYLAGPVSVPPANSSAGGPGTTLDPAQGTICPSNGDASGSSTASIIQTDEHSGGSTQTEVPHIENTSPMLGEIVYGPFTAVAEAGMPGPNGSTIADTTSRVALDIRRAGTTRVLIHIANVNTPAGVHVRALSTGNFTATWTLTDANGDTRTVTSRFVSQSSGSSTGGGSSLPKPSSVACGTHAGKLRCFVLYRKGTVVRGRVSVKVARGSTVAGLGHANVHGDYVTVVMSLLHKLTKGNWTVTVVLSSGRKSVTTRTRWHVS